MIIPKTYLCDDIWSSDDYVTWLCDDCWSSRLKVFCKKDVLKNSRKFTWKHICWSSFSVKLQTRDLHLYKIRTTAQVYCSEFVWFFRTTILYITYDYHMLYKISVLKILAPFTVKFMWAAASGITENIFCLVVCKFIDVL